MVSEALKRAEQPFMCGLPVVQYTVTHPIGKHWATQLNWQQRTIYNQYYILFLRVAAHGVVLFVLKQRILFMIWHSRPFFLPHKNSYWIMEVSSFHKGLKRSRAIAHTHTRVHTHIHTHTYCTTGIFDSLVIYEGIFIDGLYDRLERYLGGQSVAVLDHWLSIRTIPTVHCRKKTEEIILSLHCSQVLPLLTPFFE